MKVLVVGKGGREHALVWKIAQSPRLEVLYAAPGNEAMAPMATCLSGFRLDTPFAQRQALEAEILKLRDFARDEGIDLTVVGPEDVLAAGIVDCFEEAGLDIFGPTAEAARLESDKAFSKELMEAVGVPTARHRSFTDAESARQYIREVGAPIVVKAAGLAAGKGVVVARDTKGALDAVDAMMDNHIFGEAGAQVVVEEFMEGEEASLFAICDGDSFVSLMPAQDHKPIGEGDRGPNTGGMGAYAPTPVMTRELVSQTEKLVVEPVLSEMRRRGVPFRGVLYCGLMITEDGVEDGVCDAVRVVEFNCRFGDPEAQVVLPLMNDDLLDLLEAAVKGELSTYEAGRTPEDGSDDGRAAVCVVLACEGYPGSYESGKVIRGLDALEARGGVTAFHAGTATRDGEFVTSGGRVLGITAVDAGIRAAVQKAYGAVDAVAFEGMYCRRDIGHRALSRLDAN